MTTAAYAEFSLGNFDAAACAYRDLLAHFPDDTVAQRMLKKCLSLNGGQSS